MGITVVVEPRLSVDDKCRTDGIFICSSQIDVSVVHPSALSYRRAASKPLGAALGREKLKIIFILNAPATRLLSPTNLQVQSSP